MITITPEMTAEQLCSLSGNLKNAIISMAGDLKTVTEAMKAKNQAHKVEVENLKKRHEAELAELINNYNDSAEAIEKNTEFISAIERMVSE